MVDGRSDGAAGTEAPVADAISAEFYAATLGLRDLAARVKRAGKAPAAYCVELRCSQAAAGWFESADGLPDDAFGARGFAPADWLKERAPWGALRVLGVGAG